MSPGSRIFVVDDEPVIASSLAAILRMNGFPARSFTSPLEALTAARSESPDLIISDVTMPGISGIDLAIQMRAQYPNCKILLFSGQATTLDLLESARARGYDFRLLQKPVHPSEFLFEIGQLFQGRLQSLPLAESLNGPARRNHRLARDPARSDDRIIMHGGPYEQDSRDRPRVPRGQVAFANRSKG
jgi:DNA-binding NtrC family response regulator